MTGSDKAKLADLEQQLAEERKANVQLVLSNNSLLAENARLKQLVEEARG